MNEAKTKSITLKNFSLMKEGSPIYYSENFGVKEGKLVPMHGGVKLAGNTTTGFSAMAVVLGMASIYDAAVKNLYAIDDSAQIFVKKLLGSQSADGLIKDMNIVSNYPDILALGDGVHDKLIFSTASGIYRIFRGVATGGSTTQMTDTGLPAWFDYGSDTMVGDTIINLTDGGVYTVTDVVANPNADTLQFAAGAGFGAGDQYAIVHHIAYALSDNNAAYGRKIIEFGQEWVTDHWESKFYILNGDYLAKILYNITTKACTYTAESMAIDAGYIARCGASNGETMLIGANRNDQGKIFLRDKNSNGWLREVKTDNTLQAITVWKSNYVFISGGSIFLTDGYSIQKMADFPDNIITQEVEVNPNGLTVYGDKLVIVAQNGVQNRRKNGIYVFDLIQKEFSYSPYDYDGTVGIGKISGNAVAAGAIYFDSKVDKIIYSFGTGGGVADNFVLTDFSLDKENNQGVIITEPISLGRNASVKKIEVNILPDNRQFYNNDSPSIVVDCKISKCDRPLWRYNILSLTSETYYDYIVVDDTTAIFGHPRKGDEVMFVAGKNGFLRRSITAISSEGTAYEILTLDAAFANFPQVNEVVQIMPFQRYGMTAKTINEDTLNPGILEFKPSLMADNIQLELSVLGTLYPNLIIESIKIYFD